MRTIDKHHAYALKNRKYLESLVPKDRSSTMIGGLTPTQKKEN